MSKIQEFDFSVDLLQSILWQYNDATKLQSLMQSKQDWYNQNVTEFWNNWHRDVFNLDTANDFGLTVWAKILNISFAIPKPERTDNNFWGFGEFRKNFGNGNFKPVANEEIILTTSQKRVILKLRFLQIISRATVPEINKALSMLFGYNVYVLDAYDMTSNYIVSIEQIPRDIQFILDNYDLIPRPSAVGIKVRTYTGREFGFGQYHNNFNNSYFGKNT